MLDRFVRLLQGLAHPTAGVRVRADLGRAHVVGRMVRGHGTASPERWCIGYPTAWMRAQPACSTPSAPPSNGRCCDRGSPPANRCSSWVPASVVWPVWWQLGQLGRASSGVGYRQRHSTAWNTGGCSAPTSPSTSPRRPPRAVLDATGGVGVDVVVDTSAGAVEPVSQAVACVRDGGTIVLGGLKAGRRAPVDIDAVVLRAIRIQGVRSAGWDAYEMALHHLAGDPRLGELRTHVFTLNEADAAVGLVGRRRSRKGLRQHRPEPLRCVRDPRCEGLRRAARRRCPRRSRRRTVGRGRR